MSTIHRRSPSPTRVTDPDGTFRTVEYDELGQPTRVVDGSGRARSYEYDRRGRLAAIVDGIGSRWTFEYDGDLLVRATDALGRITQFAYDANGRLVQETDPLGGITAFTYDASGRMLSETDPLGRTTTYTYDDAGNLLSRSINPTTSFEYDAAGNLVGRTRIADGARTEFILDHRNRLVRAEQRASGGELLLGVSYEYDLFDRRIGKTVDPDGEGPLAAETERYWYSADEIWADLDAAGNISARYLHGAWVDEIMARDRADDGVAWYLGDQLGTVRDIAGAAGQVVDHVDYTTFGAVTSESDAAQSDRFKFTGRELDDELGLYYYRARYYDPNLGRFISEDTYGFDAGDPNLYRYVVNGPTNASDPTGHVAAMEYATLAVKIAEKLIEPLGCIEDNLALFKAEFDPLGGLDFIPKPKSLGPLDNAKMIPTKAIFRGVTGLKVDKKILGRVVVGEVPLAEAQDLYITVTSCSRFLPAAHFGATMAQLATVLDLYTRSKPHTTVTSAFQAASHDEISQFSLEVFGSLSRDAVAFGGSGPGAGGPNDPTRGTPPVSGGGPGGTAGTPDPPSAFGSPVSGAVAYLCHIRPQTEFNELLIAYVPCEDFPWAMVDQQRELGIATELIEQLDPQELLRGRTG